MNDWTISETVPAGWSDLCERNNSVFQSAEWMMLLERSFGCRSTYFLSQDHRRGFAISQFRAGPFRVGYFGFPVGGIIGGGVSDGELLELLGTGGAARMPVAVRIPVSGFGERMEFGVGYEATPETAITNLPTWDLAEVPKNRRRDVNKSLRSGLDLVDASDPEDAARIFELYRKTLERKGGSLRYNAAYFRGLVQLARRNPRLRVALAKKNNSIAAFTVVALHGDVAFYLHGAYDWSMKEYLPSAMLLNEAIEWAKSEGCQSFNLMSSPKGQESLVKHKERWRAETREHRTYTVPVGSTYPVFCLAERLYRLLQ